MNTTDKEIAEEKRYFKLNDNLVRYDGFTFRRMYLTRNGRNYSPPDESAGRLSWITSLKKLFTSPDKSTWGCRHNEHAIYLHSMTPDISIRHLQSSCEIFREYIKAEQTDNEDK